MSLLVSTACISLVICSYYLCRFLVNFCLRMATSSQRISASPPSTEPSAPRWKYDVFLSFRGEETRKGIAIQIYDGLKNRGGIKTYMDEQELQPGAPISPSLLKAIEESRFAIIVLSPNYASSPWCLEELTKIVDCMEDENRILPLFYHVEPSDVRHQNNSFEVAFAKHEATKRHDRERVKQWRDALKTVANFSGWDLQNYKTEKELVEAIVESVFNKVRSTEHFKSNLPTLKTKLKELGAARDEVQHKVDQVKRIGGKRIETSVENWMTNVDAIITKAETFLKYSRHAQTECLDGFCPNLALCNQLSKELTKLVEEIVQLYGKKEFSNFAYDVLPQEVCILSTGHYTAFRSRNSIVASVMTELRSPDIEMILVYGIGGVGKTTVVEEVLRQAKHDNLFDDVVMVRDVKQNPDHQKIQKEITKKLGLSIVENDTLAERAPKLCDRIKDKRTLVVLDDVWEQIDLTAIGLPCLVNCKLVLTCRSRKDLSMDMRTQKDISLDVLNEKEAWGLFEKMAGEVVKDGSIRNVAMEVAKKCGGLPLLIVTVARALKGKNKLYAWNDTLRRLGRFDKEELMEKAYLSLEWSYDQLEDKELKPLFLLCGTIVIKNRIYLEHLFKYGMGLGLFKNVNTMEEARDLLGTLVEKLIDSCLLLVSDAYRVRHSNMYFRMHDLVCEVASQIASRDQHVLSVGYGGELKEWPDKDFFKRCSKMSLESNNIPMLSGVPRECPKLEMFYLYNTAESAKSVGIPSSFFSEMEKLEVLGLTELNMVSLPSSLQFLKNLQTLCLEQCELGDIALVGHLSNLEILSFAWSSIKQLPKEIGKLIRLRWLDLSNCRFLKVISPDVISKLERLEDLTMRNSFDEWEAERGGSNASLLELKLLSQLTALEIYIPDADILPTNLFSNKLVRYQIYIGDAWKKISHWEKTMAETTLNTLKLKLSTNNVLDQGLKRLLKRCEDLSLDGAESDNSIVHQLDIEVFQQLKHLHLQNNVDFTDMIDRKVVFSNLTTLSVHSCGRLRFLFSFSMATSLVELKHLKVSTCETMEKIVSTRDQSYKETIDNMFQKLESLTLDKLPNLVRFCARSYIEFPLEKNFDTELGTSIHDHRIGTKLDVKDEIALQNCLFDSQVVFSNLTTLSVHSCGRLRFLFSFSMATSLVELKHLKVSTFETMEEIVSTRDQSDKETIDNVFHKLESLTLDKLPNLVRFCTPSYIEFPLEKNFDTEQEASICDHRIGKKLDVKDVTVLQNCLVDSQVKFLSLKKLRIRELRKLQTIWNNQLVDQDSFCRLREVEVSKCKNMLKIFSTSVARSLQNLYNLTLEKCDEVEEVIVGEEGPETTPPLFVFPKVRRVRFCDMPKLSRFYPRMHASKWPFLEEMFVIRCGKVKIFAAELPIFGKKHESDPLLQQSLFLINKDSFPNLEELETGVGEIWYGPSSPAHFFPKLKSISFRNCTPFSKQAALVFLQTLQNLDTLGLCENDSEVIFVNEEEMNSGGEMETHAVGTHTRTLPRVKRLCLSKLRKHLHVGGNHNSHPAGPLFPNLDSLHLSCCNELKSTVVESSSSISFRYLTTLQVSCCDGLEYLMTCYVAKTLMQLTTLQVQLCEGLREIIKVASNPEDDDDHCKIVFSRLQRLTLRRLPRLQGFCSGNCIVKLPSSTIIIASYKCPIELKISSQGVLLSNSKSKPTEEVDRS